MELVWSLVQPGSQAPVDFVNDPRMELVSYAQLKAFLKEEGLEPKDLQFASTKFALIGRAELFGIDLDPLLQVAAAWNGGMSEREAKRAAQEAADAAKAEADLAKAKAAREFEAAQVEAKLRVAEEEEARLKLQAKAKRAEDEAAARALAELEAKRAERLLLATRPRNDGSPNKQWSVTTPSKEVARISRKSVRRGTTLISPLDAQRERQAALGKLRKAFFTFQSHDAEPSTESGSEAGSKAGTEARTDGQADHAKDVRTVSPVASSKARGLLCWTCLSSAPFADVAHSMPPLTA